MAGIVFGTLTCLTKRLIGHWGGGNHIADQDHSPRASTHSLHLQHSPAATLINQSQWCGMAVCIKGDILSRKNIFCQYADIPGPLLATCTVKIKDRWKKVEGKGSASSKSNILYLLYTGTGRYTAQEPLNNCLCKRNVFETFVLT